MVLPWAIALDVVVRRAAQLQHRRAAVNINADRLRRRVPASEPGPDAVRARTPGAAAMPTDAMRAIRGYGIDHACSGPRLADIALAAALGQPPLPERPLVRLQRHVELRPGREHGAAAAAQRRRHVHRARRPGAGGRAAREPRPDRAHHEGELRVGHARRPRASGRRPRRSGYILNDWQLSGIWTGNTGPRLYRGLSYQNGGGNVNLTGSPDYGGRISLVGRSGLGLQQRPAAPVQRRRRSQGPPSAASGSSRATTTCAAASRARSTCRSRATSGSAASGICSSASTCSTRRMRAASRGATPRCR